MKKIVLIILSFTMAITLSISTISANSSSDNQNINSYSFEDSEEKRIEDVKKEIKEKYNLETTEGLIIERYDATDKSHIKPRYTQTKVGEVTKVCRLGEAGNQPENGVTFQNGGTIYWQEGGKSVDVSFSIAGKVFSASVGIGNRKEGVTAHGMKCLPGQRTKMGVEKTIKFVTYKCVGFVNGSTWIDDYVTTQTLMHIYFYNCI